MNSVILTTMRVKDLKDQAGDLTRGRKTVPLVLGDEVSRCPSLFLLLFGQSAVRFSGKLGWSAMWLLQRRMGLSGQGAIQTRVDSRREDAKTWR
jgi:hypothetical protein